MFFACGVWCLADVSSVSPSSEQTERLWGKRDKATARSKEVYNCRLRATDKSPDIVFKLCPTIAHYYISCK